MDGDGENPSEKESMLVAITTSSSNAQGRMGPRDKEEDNDGILNDCLTAVVVIMESFREHS
jgi:hypothetical protein